jgi:hypothetical protein
LLATLISAPVLAIHGWWLLVPTSTAVLSWVAYRAAVRAATSYGQQLHVAFDLHRFNMLRGLHLPLPPDLESEIIFNDRLTTFLSHSPGEPSVSIGPYQHADEQPKLADDNESGHGLLPPLSRLLRLRCAKKAK